MKRKKSTEAACHLCGAKANEVILERIKKGSAYICEYCLQEQDQYGYKAIIRNKFGDAIADGFDPYQPADDEQISPHEDDYSQDDEW